MAPERSRAPTTDPLYAHHLAVEDATGAASPRHRARVARRAIAFARGSLPESPRAGTLLARAGRLLLLAGHPEEALQVVTEAVRLAPRVPSVRQAEWHHLLAGGRVDEVRSAAHAVDQAEAGRADVPAVALRMVTGAIHGSATAVSTATVAMRELMRLAWRDTSACEALGQALAPGPPGDVLARGLPRAGAFWDAWPMIAPPWQGEPLAGCMLLHFLNGDVADQLRYLRFAAHARRAGAEVLVRCAPWLHGLVQAAGVTNALTNVPGPFLFPDGVRRPDYVLHTDASSPVPETVVPTDPAGYLRLQAPSAAPPFLATLPGIRVGLVWAGPPGHVDDAFRSMPMDALRRLVATTPGVSWVSLQDGPRAADARASALSGRVHEASPPATSALDLAQWMAHLDLVIAVDSAAAHLAGATGVPVWTLLAPYFDLRWGLAGEQTPLYPQMRVIRDGVTGGWDAAVDRVARELGAVAPRRFTPTGGGA